MVEEGSKLAQFKVLGLLGDSFVDEHWKGVQQGRRRKRHIRKFRVAVGVAGTATRLLLATWETPAPRRNRDEVIVVAMEED
jgi:hypothetical protein